MKIEVIDLPRKDDRAYVLVVLAVGEREHRKRIVLPDDPQWRKSAIRKALGEALKDELYEACPEGRHLWIGE